MIKSLGMLSLCVAIMFVFSTASFAKTKASVPNETSRAMQAKLIKEGLTIKDSQGNTHFITYSKIKTACSAVSNGKRGFWACLANSVGFWAEYAACQIYCSQGMMEDLINRAFYDFFECGWFTINIDKKRDVKSVTAKNTERTDNDKTILDTSRKLSLTVK